MKNGLLLPFLILASCSAPQKAQEALSYPDQLPVPELGVLPGVFRYETATTDMMSTWGVDSRAEELFEALERKNYRSAAIQINILRGEHPASETLFALQIYSILKSDGPEEAERQARGHPHLSSLCSNFSWALTLQELGRHKEALPLLEETMKVIGETPEILREATESALESGHALKALDFLSALNVDEKEDLELLAMQARAFQLVGRNRDAYQGYRRLAAIESTNTFFWNEAGLCAFYSEEYETAAQCFETARAVDPQEPRFAFNLGCALDWGGDPSGAEFAYLRALELNPGHLKAAENLVEVWMKQSRWLDARRLLEKMLAQPVSVRDSERIRQLIFQVDETMSRISAINEP